MSLIDNGTIAHFSFQSAHAIPPNPIPMGKKVNAYLEGVGSRTTVPCTAAIAASSVAPVAIAVCRSICRINDDGP